MDSAEQINNELKWLNRWIESNKISIYADKTKYKLFYFKKAFDTVDDHKILLSKFKIIIVSHE